MLPFDSIPRRQEEERGSSWDLGAMSPEEAARLPRAGSQELTVRLMGARVGAAPAGVRISGTARAT